MSWTKIAVIVSIKDSLHYEVLQNLTAMYLDRKFGMCLLHEKGVGP